MNDSYLFGLVIDLENVFHVAVNDLVNDFCVFVAVIDLKI